MSWLRMWEASKHALQNSARFLSTLKNMVFDFQDIKANELSNQVENLFCRI